MKINELFTSDKVKWNWDFRGSEEVDATFVIGEVQYKFYAYTTPQEPGTWEVEFRVVEGGPPGNRFGITGTGNAALVMSAVVDILKAFLQEYKGKIKQLYFSAREQSRRDLYARMVRRLLPTWEFKQTGRDFVLSVPTTPTKQPV
jgi:hypothetical protein